MTVPPMTIELLLKYLEEHHPLAHKSARRRIATFRDGPQVNRQMADLAQNPHLIFCYEKGEAEDDLWFERERAEDLIKVYEEIALPEAEDLELLSLLKRWRKEISNWLLAAQNMRPTTAQDLIHQLAGFTLSGAQKLQQRFIKDGVDLEGPLTRAIGDSSIHDHFFDDVGAKMDNSDAILAWYLARAMTRHLT